MAENPENREQRKKLESGELAPIEEFLLGSSTHIDGRVVDVAVLLPKVRQGDVEAKIRLFTPVLSQCEGAGGEDRELVLSRRQEDRDNKKIKGSIAILEPIELVKVMKKGLNFCLELSDLDGEGLVKQNWKIYLVDKKTGDIVNDRVALDSQKINNLRLSDFNLSEIQEEERENGPVFFRTLSLKS